jgi:Rieske Fe-S protein
MDRRDFLKKSCTFCLAVGAGYVTGLFSSCASIRVFETSLQGREVRVPTSLFGDVDTHIIRVAEMEFDIGLKREPNGTFTALLLRCTHASNQLTYTGNGYVCSLHGSTFDGDGGVTHGPARNPLQQLPAKVSGSEIVIFVD